MAYQCNGHELEQTLGDGEDREAWCAAVYGVAKSWTPWATEQQQMSMYQLLTILSKITLSMT